LTGSERVFDLISAASALIGLTMAQRSREVWGIEIVEPAIGDARQQRPRLNGIGNAHFLAGDVPQRRCGR